jgi:transcription initiation factor TFIIIB Brf1 subunit/transcription initiation factor TFIIB
MRISVGANRGHYCNNIVGYAITQKRCIIDQLIALAAAYKGPKIHMAILEKVASQYNDIQRNVREEYVDTKGDIASHKFVRRDTVKDEILASLLYDACIKEGTVRKKKSIAEFMQLPTNGFARGAGIVRELVATEQICAEVVDEPIMGFVIRYMGQLDIDAKYRGFVCEMVETSEKLRIDTVSQVPSKIAGTIWILTVNCAMGITVKQIEAATDGTKKNTFRKFSRHVVENFRVFAPIFTMYDVPTDMKAFI